MARTQVIRNASGEAAGDAPVVRMGRRSVRAGVPLRLSLWRIRPAWRLLLGLQIGMIAALVVASGVPLFSQVALYAGLQGALGRDPFMRELNVGISTNAPSKDLTRKMEAQAANYMSTYLTPQDIRVQGAPDSLISTSALKFTQPSTSPRNGAAQASTAGISSRTPLNAGSSAGPLAAMGGNSGGGSGGGIILFGYTHDQLSKQMRLLDGRMPRSIPDGLEVLVTEPAASKLNLHIGSTMTLATIPGSKAQPLTLRVAGIFASVSQASYPKYDPYEGTGPDGTPEISYSAVVDSDAVMNSAYPWSALGIVGEPPPQNGEISQGPARWYMNWIYQLDVSRVTPDRINALLETAPPDYINVPLTESASAGSPNDSIGIGTGLYSGLRQYQRRVLAAQIAVGVLLVSILGLMVLFVTQMSSLLVERQEALIALLRSRGASRRQIFATFATQSIALALAALVVGPLLAVPLIRQVALALLPTQSQSAANALAGNPLSLALGLWPLALIVAAIVTASVLYTVYRASALNILALRQEAARSRRTPLWRKLYLDVLAAVLALAGYGVLAAANAVVADNPSALSATIQLLFSPFGLVAPLFLMVATTLLFLRVFPLLLRLGERLASRGRGAPAQLAFAQLARSARQSTRLIVLLALVTGFALMTLNTLATTNRYTDDAAAFDAGADFSGGPADPTADFSRLVGVRAAAKGYLTMGAFFAPDQQPQDWSAPQGLTISAVESDRYAAAITWPDANGPRSVTELMRLLTQDAPTTETDGAIPAIVDGYTESSVHVSVGSLLTIWTSDGGKQALRFRVVAVVPHIPQMHAGVQPLGGNMLVDYARYAQAAAAASGANSATPPVMNHVWLRTSGDAAALRALRATLKSGPYQLIETNLTSPSISTTLSPHDRRADAESMRVDAIYLDLTGTLLLGAATALLLALLGTIVTLWIATRDRQVPFALLRALGSGPRRIRRMVTWEHGAVCAVALTLGALLGALLTVTMAPTLPMIIFASGFGGPVESGGLPVRTVWPAPALAITLAALAVVCAVTIMLAARSAARPALAGVLRLNED